LTNLTLYFSPYNVVGKSNGALLIYLLATSTETLPEYQPEYQSLSFIIGVYAMGAVVED